MDEKEQRLTHLRIKMENLLEQSKTTKSLKDSMGLFHTAVSLQCEYNLVKATNTDRTLYTGLNNNIKINVNRP